MQTIKLTFLSICALFTVASCTSNKVIVSQNSVQPSAVEVATNSVQVNTLKIEGAKKETVPTMYASTSEVIQVEEVNNKTVIEARKVQLNAMLEKVIPQKKEGNVSTNTRKANFVEKLIIKKLEKKMNKKSAQPADFHSWNSFLKIGVILLGIGIVLAIFGLGAVGGISAFIGLLFVILGLLQEV